MGSGLRSLNSCFILLFILTSFLIPSLAVTSIHVLLLREHNRIANEVHKVNSAWEDEMIFQETRKIVGAIIQHITYNEFLPELLSTETVIHSF